MNCSRLPSLLARLFLLLGFPSLALGQSLSLNDGSILQSKTNRVGINIGSINYWDNGQLLKNLIGATNPGFEPLLDQQIWVVQAAGTTTSFTVPDQWDGVPANYWAGGTFKVVAAQSGGAELGCTGTIASNTGPNYPVSGSSPWVDPVVTTSTACNAPFSVGDIVVMTKKFFPTPESWWESGNKGGTWGSVTGGAKLVSDTTDLCATCGSQALTMDASAAGSQAGAGFYFDSSYTDNAFVLVNGNYSFTVWAKAASGSPKLTMSAKRLSSGGFNCGTNTVTLNSSWTQYNWTCSATESSSVSPGIAQAAISVTGGAAYVDNVAFQKINTDTSNTSVFRDEVIKTLQSFYGPSPDGVPGMFRYWINQNAETLDNWTAPDYNRVPTATGTGYFIGPDGAGQKTLSLEDYLVICQLLHAEPYFEVPVTFTTTDATNLIEFLGGSTGTTYGARRAALGQAEPWTSVFDTIHLSYCNECWNGGSFGGQSLAYRSGTPNSEYYYDYSVRARDIFAAMRASSSYNPSSFDLVMNAQTAVNWSMDNAIARAHPDSIEIESYMYGPVSSFSSDQELWQPALVDPFEKATNPSDVRNFYQSVHDYQSQNTCGANGTSTCKVNIYEWGQNTFSGSIDQSHLDYINAGAGQGVAQALQPLLNLQYYGIGPQSLFALSEFKNPAANGNWAKIWGSIVDMGGATNSVRPGFLGVSLVNQSIIGPMFSCPIQSNVTYNFAGSPNGISAIPAMNNVPYLYAFCFENGNKRSIVLINTDLNASHSLSFGGTNPPAGSVTVRRLAPGSLNAMNEAPTGTLASQASQNVAIATSSLSSPASISLPPYSVTALDYTVGGAAVAAAPTISPASGTYTTAQSVTLSSSTPGAQIHYTTDGSIPTTSSPTYSAPITVGTNATVQAIAVANGFTNSPVSSATYTIAPVLAAPTFSLSSGTFTTNQTVTIADSTSGVTIYYTTNGSTPTTSSSVYSSALTISATTTLKAIAVKSGYANSSVSSATYTIAPVLAAPTFSLSAGTFTTNQTVTIADSTSGVTIYFTTNGSTPTTSSSVYSSALTISATTTLKAIAVKSGYTNSSVSSATYTIAPVLPTPTFSVAAGTYASAQTVTISDSNTAAAIRYTTDGSTPTTSSSLYSGPISVASTETLKAIAVATGYTQSAVASAAYTIGSASGPTSFNYASGAISAANFQLNCGAAVTNGALVLTDGGQVEQRSAFYTKKVPVTTFSTEFTFQITNGTADGFAFVIQNGASGPWSLGSNGGGLGYQGISKSVALEFDFYANAGSLTDTMGLVTGGASNAGLLTDISSSRVMLTSGDTIDAKLAYSGTTLTVTLRDLRTNATLTKSYTVNIPSAVGATTAYVGFTGGTGALTATQKVLSWTYTGQ